MYKKLRMGRIFLNISAYGDLVHVPTQIPSYGLVVTKSRLRAGYNQLPTGPAKNSTLA